MTSLEKKKRLASELGELVRGGHLSPHRVVGWARSHKSSVLHSCFEWDNTRAAREYRLWQARELIVSVEVVYKDGKRRQVYVSPMVSRGIGYRRLTDVLKSDRARYSFLTQALNELQRVCDKYIDLTELAGVRAAGTLIRNQKAA